MDQGSHAVLAATSSDVSNDNGDVPSGDVTFLFTDVEGSTLLWEKHGEVMATALAAHDQCIRDAVAGYDGYVFTTAGDSFSVAFASPAQALQAAVASQLALNDPLEGIPIRVRMGLHIGPAVARDGDYFGTALNRTARLMAVGHGGQILVSGAFHDLVGTELPDGLELEDLGVHQLKDLSRPEHIYQLQHPGLRGRFPPLRSIRTTSTNLPVQLTSFVGRDRELKEAARLLQGTRLLTITGTGGAGKTRMAIQLGAELLDDFPAGVRMVELAPLVDPDRIPDELAKVLGVELEPDRQAIDTIAGSIGDRKLLLILDNSENLIDAVAALAENLLSRCPGLKILATSIELLRIEGEMTYRLPSLELPTESKDLDAVRNTDAVRLFTERAGQAKPDFAVTADNVGSVIAITKHLDGMPLALELAAARLRTLSVRQLADRLDERFRLLTSGRRTKVARHQTLQAAIDWSHDLLTEEEQTLFRRISTFTGDFTIEAVAAACSGDDLDTSSAVDLIAELVDKSMVAVEEGPIGENRFHLLETIRRYGSIKLEEAGETERLQHAHLDYYTDLSEDLDLRSLDDPTGVTRTALAADQDNIRTALSFGLASDRLEAVARIISALWFLWYHSGRSREAVDWSGELYARDPELPEPLLAKALHAHGTLLGIWDEPEAGIPILEREVGLRRATEDPAALSSALNNLGNLLRDADRPEEAEQRFREAIGVKRAAGLSVCMELINLGEVYLNADDYETARGLYTEAFDDATRTGDQYGVALATFDLGQCAVRHGDVDQSLPLLEQSRSAFAEQGIRPGVAEADFFLALAHRSLGRQAEAKRHLVASMEAADAHWTSTLGIWNLQVAATLAEPELGAELLGSIDAHNQGGTEHQPAYFTRDLEKAHAMIQEKLGHERFAAALAGGRQRQLADALATACAALRKGQ